MKPLSIGTSALFVVAILLGCGSNAEDVIDSIDGDPTGNVGGQTSRRDANADTDPWQDNVDASGDSSLDTISEGLDGSQGQGGSDSGSNPQSGGGGSAPQGGGGGGTDQCSDAAQEGQPCGLGPTASCESRVCKNGNCVSVAAPSTTVCRAKTWACDLVETCDGTNLNCPADKFDTTCKCPYRGKISGYELHDGLKTIKHDSFVLEDKDLWSTYEKRINELGLAKLSANQLDFNRSMTMFDKAYLKKGYYWTTGDRNVAYWIPQGLTGGTQGDVTLRVVGWHYDETNNATDSNKAADENNKDKGVRISVINSTDTNVVKYRHVLLVEPTGDSRGFKPVKNHIGGLAWIWPYLYVADTSKGMRVFDMRTFLQVSTADNCNKYAGKQGASYCGYGYAYVLPQIGAYYFPSGLSSSCKPKFSFISVDNGSGTQCILSGEYDNDPTWGPYSRLLRWPLATSGGKLKTTSNGFVTAVAAWYAGSRNLQGASSYRATNGTVYFFLNTTQYYGALIRARVGATSKVFKATDGKWGYMPEGIHLTTNDNAWVATEGHTSLPRAVYYSGIADLLP